MTQTTVDALTEYARTDQLTEDERHSLLSAKQRRHVLAVLPQHSRELSLGDLAAAVAERDPDVNEADERTLTRTMISLHHAHLPKLSDAGVLDYDPTARRVTA